MRKIRLIWLPAEVMRRDRGKAEALLEEADREEAARYLKEADRLLCLSSAWLLRKFIGPRSVVFRTETGKPLSSGCFFNLSHTEGLTGLAIADTPVGLDVEKAAREETDLRDFCLSRGERESGEAFLALFTAKEALVKAEGSGLPDDIRSVSALPLTGAVSWKNKLYFRCRIMRPDYYVSLCAEGEAFLVSEEQIHEIS